MKSPREIVDLMLREDAFSSLLTMKVINVELGYCELTMQVLTEMTNGFGIAHGGITYSLADSTLAFASNSRGKQCVSVDTNITHLARVNAGDILLAKSKEIHVGNQIAVYEVFITNQEEKRVAHFKGTVRVTEKFW
ncbi:MAG: hotdog fold thioesterase [Bacteroidetes bacterium]|nr:hotdog fold thioesterase [Bacteroidota bacterium]MBM3419126.1 hotdog fold thioesterase [Bacteroidota bacterium]